MTEKINRTAVRQKWELVYIFIENRFPYYVVIQNPPTVWILYNYNLLYYIF